MKSLRLFILKREFCNSGSSFFPSFAFLLLESMTLTWNRIHYIRMDLHHFNSSGNNFLFRDNRLIVGIILEIKSLPVTVLFIEFSFISRWYWNRTILFLISTALKNMFQIFIEIFLIERLFTGLLNLTEGWIETEILAACCFMWHKVDHWTLFASFSGTLFEEIKFFHFLPLKNNFFVQ